MKKFIMSLAGVALSGMLFFTQGAYAASYSVNDYYSNQGYLRYGMQNSTVSGMQQDLALLGYAGVTPTGYFGRNTLNAVTTIQQSNGLSVDGIVGPQTARIIKNTAILKTASDLLSIPYVWGGTTPAGFDCSGFVQYVFSSNDISLPRTAAQQYASPVGTSVARNAIKPGDLLFFSTYAPGASHVAIYIGNGQFVNASSGHGEVMIQNLNSTYFSSRYVGAKRIVN